MRTLLELERIGTGRWRLRVSRADPKGNVAATVPVEGTLDRVRSLVHRAVGEWALLDEVNARRTRACGSRR